MEMEGRWQVGQRVRHRYPGIGLGTIIADDGDPEDRGAYLVRYDNGQEYQTSRCVLEAIPDGEAGTDQSLSRT